MRLYLLAGLMCTLCGASAAHASTLLVTESGTFSYSTPNSSISATHGTFALSFNVDSSPTVLAASAHQFDVAYSNFSFLLNGAANTSAVGSITFFDTSTVYVGTLATNNGGLFSVCFATPCPSTGLEASPNSLVFIGPQIFNGSTTNPTILTGSFANTAPYAVVNGSVYNFLRTNNANVSVVPTAVAVTPEPSSLALLGTGLIGLVGFVRRRAVSV